ncbi:hypothetical protein KSP40_PGU009959 [Platanthera guangdongensis]|uniref:Bifunctional inhibitor/plant lipid transfer protein/seed storage helical domain-containing protein n=1 Tax=Platanthera guangdongensis TaxID=2320717 RepID=A0ABR2M834_9ASPA
MAPATSSHIPALLLLLAAVTAAHASIYRTTITTTTATHEEVPGGAIANSKKCEEEMERHPITACHSFLKHGGGGGGNPERSVPEECCEQLRRVSNTCQCEMLKMMVGEIVKDQQAGGGEMAGECGGRCAEMKMRGAILPAMCGAGPPCLFNYGRSAAAGMY